MELPFGPEILAGFAAEVGGYLPRIRRLLAPDLEEAGLMPALEEAHRALHSIKGAGAMLGLADLAAEAEEGESLLEAVLSGRASFGAAERERLGETLEALAAAFPAAESEAAPAGSPSTEPAFERVGLELESDDLWDTFKEESTEHLERAAALLRQLATAEKPDREVLQRIRRSIHTVKGAAAMVGAAAVASLSHRMEDLLDRLYDGDQDLDPEAAALLSETNDALEDLVRRPGPSESAATEELLASFEERYSRALPVAAPALSARAAALAEESAEAATGARAAGERLRVPVAGLDELVRLVSELVVARSVFERRYQELGRQVAEVKLTSGRLRGIAARLETDYEVSALRAGGSGSFRLPGAWMSSPRAADFDELELDRYTEFHQLSRALTEASSDLTTLGGELGGSVGDFEASLTRLRRLTGELQDRLFGIRMVPLASLSARLQRTVRVTARERAKLAELVIEGEGVGLDKQILDVLADPLLHLVRNAVDHGLEAPGLRRALGKPEQGRISIVARQQGSEVVLEIADDGAGLDLEAIRAVAAQRGLAPGGYGEGATWAEAAQWIFLPGFSTATSVDEVSGRGVGLDVVRSTVESLRGSVRVESTPQLGTRFILRLPVQLAVLKVLLVEVGSQRLALPLPAVDRVLRFEPSALEQADGEPVMRVGEDTLPLLSLGEALGFESHGSRLAERAPALVLRSGGSRLVAVVSRLGDAQEVVVKSLGSLLPRVPGFLGATLLGDGSVVLIADPDRLFAAPEAAAESRPGAAKARALTVMVVDDSLSVRKVLSSLLAAQGWKPIAARDGMEALEILASLTAAPDALLVDIEMPRLDGYELLTTLRSQSAYRALPVVMLTSRAGQKHRDRAFELGASDYLVKPYHPEVLVDTLARLTERASRRRQEAPGSDPTPANSN
ncbi:MAG: Hpt domain-containing protein [Thermoanaerobaculia bacterium]